MASRNEIEELIHEGDVMRYGAERTRMHSEAVRIADLHQNLDAGYKARQALITSATLGGDPNLSLVAFAWCLGQHDANPDRFPLELGGYFTNLLWEYKWIVEQAGEHHLISRAKLAELRADMARRYAEGGYSLRPVRKLELCAAMNMFDSDQIPGALRGWLEQRRDSMSDCQACDVDCEAAAHLAMRDLTLASRAAAPLFEHRISCAEVPTLTYGRFLLPLSQQGEEAEAGRLAHLLPRKIGANQDFVEPAGALIIYLVEHHPQKALRAASSYAAWALAGASPLHRLVLMIGLVRASRLAREMGKGAAPLGTLLPNEPMTSFEEGEKRLQREALDLADAFDRRNGHKRQGDAVRERLDGAHPNWWPL